MLAALLLAGCGSFDDALYFNWDDRRVVCAQNVDNLDHKLNLTKVVDRMQAAAANRQVYNLYAHVPGAVPGETVSIELLENVLAEAERLHLGFVTYHDMLDHSAPRAGLALSFDDDAVDAWFAMRGMLRQHGARVTFFVTRYHSMSDATKAELFELAGLGHDIQGHGVEHLSAPQYVAEHGLEAYLRDEALPSIDALVADGLPASVFAYPRGERTDEIDRALLEHVDLVRTTAGQCPW